MFSGEGNGTVVSLVRRWYPGWTEVLHTASDVAVCVPDLWTWFVHWWSIQCHHCDSSLTPFTPALSSVSLPSDQSVSRASDSGTNLTLWVNLKLRDRVGCVNSPCVDVLGAADHAFMIHWAEGAIVVRCFYTCFPAKLINFLKMNTCFQESNQAHCLWLSPAGVLKRSRECCCCTIHI